MRIALVFVFGFVGLAHAETIDKNTQRNGMHSCPVGQFMVGEHISNNTILCTPADGDFAHELVDKSTQFEGMHACPAGMAMTGVHEKKNLLACVKVTTPLPRVVDLKTQRLGMHACPPGNLMSGNQISKNWLLCGTDDSLAGAELLDTGTQRNGFHSCPPGRFVTGIQNNDNYLLCAKGSGDFAREIVDSSTQSYGMHACPEGSAMTGLHANKNLLSCVPFTGQPVPRVVDRGTQRSGMHACPGAMVYSGVHINQNLALCGTEYQLNIKTFTASKTYVTKGQSVQLNWEVICNAPDCAVHLTATGVDKIVPKVSSLSVAPSDTTDYTLKAMSGGGEVQRGLRVSIYTPPGATPQGMEYYFLLVQSGYPGYCSPCAAFATSKAGAQAICQHMCGTCTITDATANTACPMP